MRCKLPYKALNIAKRLNKRKNVSVSLGGQTIEVDISGLIPLIDHEYFQQMTGRKQLANAMMVYPDATHTRFHHSLDVMRLQRERNRFWLEYGMITPEDAAHLEVFALLHDIGHGAFSHTLDRVCSINHDQNGAKKIDGMKEAIEQCNVSFERIKALFQEDENADPLYGSVLHHPLGTDKLSYLFMDAYHCITGRPDSGKLPQYIYWLNDQLMVHAKCAMQAIDLKRFYIMMYREVYMRKSCLISQRILEKTIRTVIKNGQLDESRIWNLIDAEMIAFIRQVPDAQKHYIRYRSRISKCVVAFRLSGFALAENVSEKLLMVYEKDEESLNLLGDHSSTDVLDAKEIELAAILGIDPGDIDIVPAMGRHRFAPPAITILNGSETFLDTELFPENDAAIQEFARAVVVFRVCVNRNLREKIHKKANLINEFFDKWIKEIS